MTDYGQYEEALRAARTSAVAAAEQSVGLGNAYLLAAKALPELAGHIGVGLADSVQDKYADALLTDLTSSDQRRADVAWGWAVARFEREGWPWVDNIVGQQGADPRMQAAILRATRDFPRAWERADQLGPDVAAEFWRRFGPYGLGPEFAHQRLVVERLLGERRFVAAIKLLALYSRRSDGSNAEVVVKVLKGYLSGADQDADQAALNPRDLTPLFEYLNAKADPILRKEIAQLGVGISPCARGSSRNWEPFNKRCPRIRRFSCNSWRSCITPEVRNPTTTTALARLRIPAWTPRMCRQVAERSPKTLTDSWGPSIGSRVAMKTALSTAMC